MTKTLRLFGREIATFPTCYGLPTFVAATLGCVMWLVIWSYHAKPVRFTKVVVEQMGSRTDYVTLRITKFVTWNRLCSGTSEQEIRPLIAVDNPTKVSGSPIKLDGHVINVPPHRGENAQEGDPAPYRFIVLPAGQISAGSWRYTITSKVSCWPWEYIWPIVSDTATADFKVQ